MQILFIIIWILLFVVLILIHELGHFIAAKKAWVKVLEFGFGIPPRAFKFYTDKSWTEYTINWIPLWWFVRLKWESPENEEEFNAPDSFMWVNIWKKLTILLAWISMNLVFAWILFTIIFTIWIKPMQLLPKNALPVETHSYLMPTEEFLTQQWFLTGKSIAVPLEVIDVSPNGLAAKNDILSWDIFLTINNNPVDSLNIWTLLKDNYGKSFDLKIQRWDQQIDKNITCPPDSCLLNIIHSWSGDTQMIPIKFDFVTAMWVSVIEMKEETVLTYHLLWALFSNLVSMNKQRIQSSMEKMSGPIWAVKVGEIILQYFGFLHYLSFAAMISLALWIFNVLPIPALDWWRTLWILIQKIFRLKPEKYFTFENYVNMIFFILLMWFGIYVMLLDLQRFWNVSIPWIW